MKVDKDEDAIFNHPKSFTPVTAKSTMGSVADPLAQKRSISAADIAALQELLPSAIVLDPAHANYAASIHRWSSAAEKPAGLVVTPHSTDEVAAAVRYATQHSLDLAVKCGGHSTAGASSTHGGLLIDLHAHMRGVAVDLERQLFRVQGGANWGDVDSAGHPHGLATVGGTVTDTGVGGLVLGGGYGWLSGQRGLSIDNLVEATVVLADGTSKTVSADSAAAEDADLFWALMGAGQNFGVVTEFVLRAFPQGDVWGGMLLFEPTREKIDLVVAATNDLYAPDAQGNVKIAGRAGGGLGFLRPPPAGGKTMLAVTVIFFGAEADGRAVFADFFAAGPLVDDTAVMPYPKSNTILAPPIGLRASMKGAAFAMPIRPAFVEQVRDSYAAFTDANDDTGISLVLWEMFDPTQVVARDAGCFANRGWALNGMICPLWTKPENDAECRQWARDLSAMFKREIEDVGGAGVRGEKGAVLLYGNYDRESFLFSSLVSHFSSPLSLPTFSLTPSPLSPFPWSCPVPGPSFFPSCPSLHPTHYSRPNQRTNSPLSAEYDERSRDIFGANYPRLQQLKARYDPTNMFNKLFAITPTA